MDIAYTLITYGNNNNNYCGIPIYGTEPYPYLHDTEVGRFYFHYKIKITPTAILHAI